MPFLPQRFTHCRAGVCFRDGIKVTIDICRGAHVAMSEPFLDLLHRYALGKKFKLLKRNKKRLCRDSAQPF